MFVSIGTMVCFYSSHARVINECGRVSGSRWVLQLCQVFYIYIYIYIYIYHHSQSPEIARRGCQLICCYIHAFMEWFEFRSLLLVTTTAFSIRLPLS